MDDHAVLYCICCREPLIVPMPKFLEYARKFLDDPEYTCPKCIEWLTWTVEMATPPPKHYYLPPPR
jgi:hypothetical protein